jgi:hypothetical protein
VFLNDLHVALRPTIQTYNAYTVALQQLDAEWYLGSRAPAWSLVDLRGIDARWPASEDALALNALRAAYAPVATERRLLLVRHRDTPAPDRPDREVVLEREAGWGETVSVPRGEGSLYLALDVAPSLPGSLRAALWRAPTVRFEVLLEGAWETYRVVPLRSGPPFLLAPALLETADLVDWARGEAVAWPEAFRLRPEDGTAYAFAPHYRLRIERGGADAFEGGPVRDLAPIPRDPDAR